MPTLLSLPLRPLLQRPPPTCKEGTRTQPAEREPTRYGREGGNLAGTESAEAGCCLNETATARGGGGLAGSPPSTVTPHSMPSRVLCDAHDTAQHCSPMHKPRLQLMFNRCKHARAASTSALSRHDLVKCHRPDFPYQQFAQPLTLLLQILAPDCRDVHHLPCADSPIKRGCTATSRGAAVPFCVCPDAPQLIVTQVRKVPGQAKQSWYGCGRAGKDKSLLRFTVPVLP